LHVNLDSKKSIPRNKKASWSTLPIHTLTKKNAPYKSFWVFLK